jgi:hypothetical protein
VTASALLCESRFSINAWRTASIMLEASFDAEPSTPNSSGTPAASSAKVGQLIDQTHWLATHGHALNDFLTLDHHTAFSINRQDGQRVPNPKPTHHCGSISAM